MTSLPTDRSYLVIDWRPTDDPKTWIAHYCLRIITQPIHRGYHALRDPRAAEGQPYVEVEVENTKCGNMHPWELDGSVFAPFRSGQHILWDAQSIGLPAFATCLDRVHPLEVSRYEVTYGWCPECRLWTSDAGFGITDHSECDHCSGPVDGLVITQAQMLAMTRLGPL